jgi:hypothetical protein
MHLSFKMELEKTRTHPEQGNYTTYIFIFSDNIFVRHDQTPTLYPLYSPYCYGQTKEKKYTSRLSPTSTARQHHSRSSQTCRSSVIPPLLHPLPTPLSLKFCDHLCAVRTQTHNLSNSESSQPHPLQKKCRWKRVHLYQSKKKNCRWPNSQPYDSKFFTTPRQQDENFKRVSISAPLPVLVSLVVLQHTHRESKRLCFMTASQEDTDTQMGDASRQGSLISLILPPSSSWYSLPLVNSLRGSAHKQRKTRRRNVLCLPSPLYRPLPPSACDGFLSVVPLVVGISLGPKLSGMSFCVVGMHFDCSLSFLRFNRCCIHLLRVINKSQDLWHSLSTLLDEKIQYSQKAVQF